MKIFKSKGGYFYKVYKNGKKKRISKREYLKIKNKTNNKLNFKIHKRQINGHHLYIYILA